MVPTVVREGYRRADSRAMQIFLKLKIFGKYSTKLSRSLRSDGYSPHADAYACSTTALKERIQTQHHSNCALAIAKILA